MSHVAIGLLCWSILQFAVESVRTVPGFLLVTLLSAGSVSDLRHRRIPNILTYSTVILAVAWNAQVSIVDAPLTGGIGVALSFTGVAVCFLVMLLPYSMSNGVSAGDVKLSAAVGAVLGPVPGLYVIATSHILATIAILAAAVYRKGTLPLIVTFGRKCLSILLPMHVMPPTEDDTRLVDKGIPIAPFFAVGTIITVLEIIPT